MLQRLLRSITFSSEYEVEVIIVDDASTDVVEYQRVVDAWRGVFPSFHYLRLPRRSGAPVARNAGIRTARYEWIALVDDDDEWLPGKLDEQMGVARRVSSDAGLIYCWTRVVNADGVTESVSQPDVEGDAASFILRTNFILSPSVVIRKAAFNKVGMFDEALPSCQDWDMWARILCGGFSCRVVRKELAVYHRHGGPSVGLSPRARTGYLMFLDKHWRRMLRHTGPVNWARKLVLYVRLSRHRV
jgi:glycosyltransferase involved in cell wall biosynthesis